MLSINLALYTCVVYPLQVRIWRNYVTVQVYVAYKQCTNVDMCMHRLFT